MCIRDRTNIDDSRADHPELFTDRIHQISTIQLWQFLAERYKDRWIVAGYDLMNEPLPEWNAKYNHKVMPLYKEIISAIRDIDQHHMIVLEGVHWSTDWSIFDEILDNNVLYQFHKYWNNPDVNSLQEYLYFRAKHQVPIFMGEGGENNKEWYIGAFSMFEDLDISWNFWTYKKMENNNSLCSIKKPKDWDILVDNLKEDQVTDAVTANRILDEFVDNVRFDSCLYYKDVVDALLCRAPITIPAIFYAYHGMNVGYYMAENYEKNVDFRPGDHTYIEHLNNDKPTINFSNGAGQLWGEADRTAVRILEGEWLNYRVLIPKEGLYKLTLSSKNLEDLCRLEILVDDYERDVLLVSGKTIGESSLKRSLVLSKGYHTLRIRSLKGGTFLEWLRIED